MSQLVFPTSWTCTYSYQYGYSAPLVYQTSGELDIINTDVQSTDTMPQQAFVKTRTLLVKKRENVISHLKRVEDSASRWKKRLTRPVPELPATYGIPKPYIAVEHTDEGVKLVGKSGSGVEPRHISNRAYLMIQARREKALGSLMREQNKRDARNTRIEQKLLRLTAEAKTVKGKLSDPLFPSKVERVYAHDNAYHRVRYSGALWVGSRHDIFVSLDPSGHVPPEQAVVSTTGVFPCTSADLPGLDYFPTNWLDSTGTPIRLLDDVSYAVSQIGEIATLVAKAKQRARLRYFSDLRGDKPHVGNIAVEADKTYEMIRDILKRIKGLLTVKSLGKIPESALVKPWSAAKRDVREVSSAYLMAHFGLNPMIQDLQSAILNLGSGASIGAFVQVKGSATEQGRVEVGGVVADIDVTARYQCKFDVVHSFLGDLQAFGLLNPFEPLWELTPGSYIVDWFYRVSDLLAAMSAHAGMTYRNGTLSTKVIVRLSQSLSMTQPWEPTSTTVDGRTDWNGSVVGFYEVKDRVLLPEPPSLVFPDFKSPISVSHSATSVALLLQRLIK